ncbi:TonB-dependent receptor [Novosphingobium aromaticivorans DSM 12444]|uniref:TonB-dependent receptor n=1 Tax=Novosphingobium aromaticivorans (strain ATCC 700278 / DSM 12444 / CCUG 56034 / CIP 105152 / NBRC 16084 / F199) TaxID=279238 RepID=Q2G3J1_NOVAD|nr:TonB-dependent receptor [Novosphingobium aromaticivorans]ABD27582.1 TonB-dependent receptor [Novosphingobium aromaticivorans DSM 12444]SCY71914.1 iron complex outermembrane recepter protein [Novosphingobium aromaticivorans]
MTRMSTRAVLAASAALFALPAVPAIAQEAPADETTASNEITVIARRREERLLDVPIAISALSTEALDKAGAKDLSGVQGAIPNVNIVQGRGSASSANFYIRGIGQPDALQTFDPAVGVYVDGVYLSRIQGALLNLFDVQRVEVLRGPQGTLYGKNTIGGAVNVVSKKPDLNDLRGEASITYGRFDEVTAKGYVSAPLVADKLALSVAGVYDDRDGIVTDPATGRKYNDRNNLSGRAILRAQPTDTVEVLISGDYTRQRNSLTMGQATAPLIGFDYNADFSAVTPFVIAPAATGEWDYKASSSFAGDKGQKLDHWGVSGTINVDLSDTLQLVSISAYRKLKTDFFVDIDATTAEVGDVFVGTRQHQFSQELQLKLDADKLKGVLGVYYLNEHVTSHQEAYADSYLRYVGTPLNFLRTIDDEQDTKSYAAFGQLTYDFTDAVSLTGGLRYTRETKEYFRTTTATTSSPIFPALVIKGTFTFPTNLPAPYNTLDSVTYEAWTPSATLSYKPSRNTMLYGSVSRGFKSGGFNGRVNGLGDVTQVVDGTTVVVPTFKPETVWTYEVGAKGSFLDGRVNISGAAFYSDYANFQARVGGGNTGINGGSFPVLNAGKLRIQGFEFDVNVRPADPVTLFASVGYLDADYKEFNDGRRAPAFSCNPTGAKVTCKPAFAPPLTLRAGGEYRVPLGDATLSLGGDVRFVDKHYLSVDNRPGLTEDGYLIGNLYAQVDFDKFYLRGAVRNVGNTLYKTDGQEFSSVGNIQTVYYGDPRTWNVTLGVRF